MEKYAELIKNAINQARSGTQTQEAIGIQISYDLTSKKGQITISENEPEFGSVLKFRGQIDLSKFIDGYQRLVGNPEERLDTSIDLKKILYGVITQGFQNYLNSKNFETDTKKLPKHKILEDITDKF